MDLYMLPPFSGGRSSGCRENACTHHEGECGQQRAVEDTVTDTETEHFIIIAVLCIFQCLVTVASHAMWA